MKKSKIISLFLAMTMVFSTILTSIGPVSAAVQPELIDGFYQISNADELYWFAQEVNSGNLSINVKLTQNIVVNEGVMNENTDPNKVRQWKPISLINQRETYSGIFDGNDKTISGLYFKDNSKNYIGLFGSLGAATIKNLGIINSYFFGQNYVGAIAGNSKAATIENCYNESIVLGASDVGGLVGSARDTSCNNCYNSGEVGPSKNQANYNNHYFGGIVGNASGTTNFKNCFNVGKVSALENPQGYVRIGPICGERASGSVENSFYLKGSVETYESKLAANGAIEKTETQFNRGEVTWLLNGLQTEGIWHQNLDNEKPIDKYPKYTGGSLYPYKKCNGREYFSNFDKSAIEINHDFDEHGICKICGQVENENIYKISNAEQLFGFADALKSNNTISGELLNDIDITDIKDFRGIGTIENPFKGNFNGNGFNIKVDINYDNNEEYPSLFRVLDGNVIIENLSVSGKIVSNQLYGSGMISRINSGANVSIEKCTTDVELVCTKTNFGFDSLSWAGLIGRNYGTVSLKNSRCFGSFELIGYSEPRGINGLVGITSSNLKAESCYTMLNYKNSSTYGDGLSTSGTIINCYYLNSPQNSNTLGVQKNAAQFVNGEVTWLLNGESDKGEWYQNIDNGEPFDLYPEFKGDKVYQNRNCIKDNISYSNTKPAETISHDFDENGICRDCGSQKPKLKDGFYEISNKEQLKWFILEVNEGNNDINGKLLNNVDTSAITDFEGIGNDKFPFKGKFDGNGYCININYDEVGENPALFRIIDGNVTIKNLGVTGEIKTSKQYAAGIVANINKDSVVTIENCYSDVNISLNIAAKYDNSWGGIIGISKGKVTLKNCAYRGTMTVPPPHNMYQVAGLVGWQDDEELKIDSCYTMAQYDSAANPKQMQSENIVRSNNMGKVSINNTYYLNKCSTSSQGIQKNAQQFANGEVTWLLNGSENKVNPVWKQTLNIDNYPNFDGKAMYMFDGVYTNEIIMQDSFIEITSDLNKIYDEKIVENPEVNKTGSTGEITFIWYKWENSTWVVMDDTPVDAGRYKVVANVAADTFYNSAESTPIEFTIGKTYGEIQFKPEVSLNREYNGRVVTISDNDLNKAGDGQITYFWYQYKDNDWYELDDSPVNVGKYKIIAHIDEGTNHFAKDSNPLEFEITKADNSFVTALTIANWTYGETPNQPVCVTRFGEAGYTYSDSIDGTYGKLPDDPHAGTWYVKAEVEGTDNYNKLISQPFEFNIIKAKPAEVNEPENLEGIYGQTLKDVKLSDGWKWIEEDTALTVVNNGYMARIKVDDMNYDYSSINGYAEGYVNRTLKVTVAQVENSWIEELEIEGWTYGKTQNSAKAKAKYGTVKYTYTDEENNVYETMPENAHAGKWTVKAVVEKTDDYLGLEAAKDFTINKAESTITIKDDLDKIYDGNAAVPTVEKTGSNGEVTYKWYENDGSRWNVIESAPSQVGRYKVEAVLSEDINYNSAKSQAKEFIISKADSGIELSGDLNKNYDGTAVVEPAVTKTGSTGEVTFKWYQGDKQLDQAPINAGSYSVKAYLAGDRNYDGVTSKPLSFEITKADNSFVTALTIANWTYGETPNQPVCVTRFGEAGYTYSDSIDGTYGKLPDDPHAGIWYVKAAVEGTDNYNKLISQPFEFSIIKAKPAEVNEPENLEGIYGQTLKDVKLSDGWKWVEEDTALTVVNNGYMARIKVDDINYDYSSINGYAEGYVNRTLKVTVAQVENSWIEELEIEGWTYGKTQNSATAKPKFGTVKYTYTDEENNVYETMPKNAHAGIWTVKAVVEATSDYQSLEAIKTFKILKAESTITIKDDLNKIYDGSAVVPTVEKTGSSGEVTYKWYEYDESGWSEMTTAPVEAGRYRVNAILAEDINYNGKVSVAKEFIISKAASTLKLSGDLNKSYDGTAVVEPAVTKTGSTGEVTFKWYQGDKELDTAPVNVGSYSVKAYLAGDRNYDGVTSKPLSFEITKADNSFVTALTIANWTYGETPNQPVCVAQFGEIKYTYSDSIDGTYGKLLDDPHAGTWYVKAEVKGTDNYEGLVSEPVAFEINKAAASDVAEPENLEGIYGQTLKDVKLSDGWKWIEEDTALTVVNNGYMARIKVDDMNYDYSSINGYVEGYVNRTLKVTVAQVENSWIEELEIEGWTYGKIQNSAKAKAKYGTVKYTYRDEENNVYETMPENAHAGTWVAIATVEATVDYKGLEATKVFNIEKAASTIKITNDLDKIYDGNAVVPTVEKTGSSGEVNIIWYENDGSRWNVIESAPLQVGRYKVEAVLSEDINYNSVKSQAKEFIISKADSTIAVSGVLNKSYDGTAVVEPAVTKTGSTGEVTFKWYQGDKQLDQAPINAGSYSVKAYLAGDRNFNSCESNQIDFVIAKADTQLEFTNNLSKEYDGIKVLSPEINKVGNTNQLKIKWYQKTGENWQEINNTPVNAGLYKVEASIAADNNYNEQKIEQKFTIAQAKNSWVEQLAISDWTYGQKADTAVGKAKFGTVVFMYTAPDGKEYSSIPEGAIAGTWTLKAKVDETENYQGLEDSLQFTINKAEAPIIVEPDNLSAVQDDQLESVQLPKGWSWVEPQDTVTVSISSYQAKLKVEDDKNYDYSPVAGYKDGYVYRMLNIAVAQGENNWVEKPNIKGWTYGQKANDPTGSAAHGEITYTYSDSITGIFTNVVPNNAGTWYMKASVPVSDEYTGLNEIIEFTIAKAIPEYSLPEGLKANYDQNLSDIELPEGFTWQEEKLFDQVGKYTFKLTYTPEDQENYETVKDIEVEVTVKQAKNEWLEELNLDGWVYGEEANKPIAQAKYGEIYYVYSKTKDGQYTTKQPNEAGVWYVKAIVDETDNYAGIESKAVEFIIEEKDAENNVVVPDIKNDNDVNNLVIKDGDKVLVDGIDYEITKTKSGNTVTVTITFKGNYKGTIVKTYQYQ